METRTEARKRRAIRVGAAGALVAIGLVGSAGTASAHTAPVDADCAGVRVTLTDYNGDGVNTVTVWVDGAPVTTTFGAATSASHPFSDPTVSHTWRVSVSAWDDPTGANGWSFDTGTNTVPVCSAPTTAPATTAPVVTEPAGTVPGPVTPTTVATVASVVITSPPSAGPTTTAVVAQAAPTVVTAATQASPTTAAVPSVASEGTLPVTGDTPWLATGVALLAFGFGILLVIATRRPSGI